LSALVASDTGEKIMGRGEEKKKKGDCFYMLTKPHHCRDFRKGRRSKENKKEKEKEEKSPCL